MKRTRRQKLLYVGLALAGLALLAVPIIRSDPVSAWLGAKQAQLKFNWVYTEGTEHFSHQPSPFLLECIQGRPAGQALDIAMGQGRNAMALARAGWQVTGFDVSDEGLKSAQLQAQAAGLEIATVLTTCADFDYGQNRWDLVAMMYAPMAFHDHALMARLKESLKPGGMIVIETFLEWDPASGAPRVDGLPGPGELARIFTDFEIVYDREFEGISEWFPRKTRLLQFCARNRTPSH